MFPHSSNKKIEKKWQKQDSLTEILIYLKIIIIGFTIGYLDVEMLCQG